jgi:hypothetical protein
VSISNQRENYVHVVYHGTFLLLLAILDIRLQRDDESHTNLVSLSLSPSLLPLWKKCRADYPDLRGRQ